MRETDERSNVVMGRQCRFPKRSGEREDSKQVGELGREAGEEAMRHGAVRPKDEW